MTNTNKQHMSLESMLDEERRDVLALLEATSTARAKGSIGSAKQGRAASPFTNVPRSPVRSMLDIAEDSGPRHSSIAGTNGGITSPPRTTVRSMLDINASPPAKAIPRSAQTSPTEANHRAHLANNAHPRSLSDAATRPAGFGPRAPAVNNIPASAYQFSGYLPSNPGGPIIPKRNTQAGKKNSLPSAMAEVMRGDLGVLGSRDHGRNNSIAGTGINNTAKSKSPHNRLGLRSSSPHLGPEPSKFVLDDGTPIDMNNAYRRLSDANLARSGGGLSSLGGKGARRRTNSGDAVTDSTRLEKDYTPIDGEAALVDSSDEDTSDEERPRGRKKAVSAEQTQNDDPESKTLGMGRAKGPRTARSLMAAAEEERKC
jgi:hypothetical protein